MKISILVLACPQKTKQCSWIYWFEIYITHPIQTYFYLLKTWTFVWKKKISITRSTDLHFRYRPTLCMSQYPWPLTFAPNRKKWSLKFIIIYKIQKDVITLILLILFFPSSLFHSIIFHPSPNPTVRYIVHIWLPLNIFRTYLKTHPRFYVFGEIIGFR